jgi:molybdate transport system substrate-binding protein
MNGLHGRLSPALACFLATAGILAALVIALAWNPHRQAAGAKDPLVVYCAAGIRGPVDVIAREYEKSYGVPVRIQYGGSQTLLANAQVAQVGDLYLPADDGYLELARQKGLVDETIPLARMTAVLAVRRGNPKHIRSLSDLLRPEVKLAQANPDAAAIGKVTRVALQPGGLWGAIEKRTTVFKPTVNDVASDIRLGTVDAGFIWDALASAEPTLETVPLSELTNAFGRISVAVLHCSRQPTAALRLARYLGAEDRGLREFARQHYQPADGDSWAETPELLLYSGAMNRVAVEDTLQRFEQREGARVTRIYNGCGILVAQMKAGGRPDAYLTCDQSFVPPVADLFPAPPVEMSDSAIVILVPKSNPRRIRSLADLGQAGLRVGVANPEQSTLGTLTQRLLEQGGFLARVTSNIVTRTPTGDMLVNQIRTGTLDAVVVYVSNTTKVRDQLEVVALQGPGTVAVQTFSVGGQSRHKQLAARLLAALKSDQSRARYEEAGFRWRAGINQVR